MKVFYLFFCFCFPLHADWNTSFDRQTHALVEKNFVLQSPEYQKSYAEFQRIRDRLCQDVSLRTLLQGLNEGQKIVLPHPREGFLIKKRQYDRIHEFYAWEISFFLDEHPSVVWAFPLYLEGKKVIVQKMEPFFLGRGRREMPPSSEIKKVSVEEYWKAHLKAYILGLGDLLGRNIGIHPDGRIRFFDAEYCFSYKNRPYRDGNGVMLGFRAESMDWPQYRMPLDRQTAKNLQDFIQSLSYIEEKLLFYEEARGISLFSEGTHERLALLRSFLLQEGKIFRDFIGHIYPTLDPGLDQLSQIVSSIYKRKVDHGAALIFVSQHIHKYNLSQEQQRDLQAWIECYLEE
ncbi:MAG: hypothetical protein FJZ58_00685 [Chlamydiae bacterium]|nr:hypothetical protein [Chlamydiota bacterium]